jgi:hypothetical protein
MSQKLTIEYVFGTIVPAYYHIAFHDPENERIALERGAVCKDCPNLNHFVQSKKYGKKCKLCGCPIVALVRSRDKNVCKGNFWKE